MTNELQGPEEKPLPLYGEVEIDLFTKVVRHGTKWFQDFKLDLQKELSRFSWMAFVGEVQVFWTIYMDEHERKTTDRGADLDNLVKGLNDCIKGPGGLLVDDSQIQSLTVRWLPRESGSDGLSMRLSVSDPMRRMLREPLRIYELSDGLYYPLPDQKNTQNKYDFLSLLDRFLRQTRESARTVFGAETEQEVYALRMIHGPSAEGFHKSRVADSGYEIVARDVWLSEMGAQESAQGSSEGDADV